MRIVAFVNNNSGPSYHRIIMPLMLLPDTDVYITNNLLEKDFEKGCDIFMYNRMLPSHCKETIQKLKQKYDFKTCVDVDDWWELDPHHILYQLYQDENVAAEQIEHMVNADFIFTTHERLANEVMQINSNVYILPNAIPRQGQFDIERRPYHLTRLFWQGSVTHGEDIALLKRPLDCLNTIAAKIKMVMAGYQEQEDEWYKMVLNYTANTKHQYKLIPGAHVNKYYAAYAEADICLIPLLNSPFNRMKSNLKVLEAANLGLPVICSDVHPYKDLPVLYAKGTGEWVTTIKRLVASKKRQKEAGSELKEYCDTYFNFHKINKERKQILEYHSQ
jgi:glycosyltransferase involved in cell wall biosynthesis